jgi:hypothetical protein
MAFRASCLCHSISLTAFFYEPGDHREELDERSYVAGGQVVQCGEDPMVRIIFDVSDSALGL